ncbi:MAG: hypothetical protein MUF62_07335 [Chitinophagaceae bacterium]|jgi:hypothetical protein|nr:hypothetical protein [Chitinophagaceae bacterium]
MAAVLFDVNRQLLEIALADAELTLAQAWLLRSDGSIYQRLQLSSPFLLDCSFLQPGRWFARLETPGHVIVKRFEIH